MSSNQWRGRSAGRARALRSNDIAGASEDPRVRLFSRRPQSRKRLQNPQEQVETLERSNVSPRGREAKPPHRIPPSDAQTNVVEITGEPANALNVRHRSIDPIKVLHCVAGHWARLMSPVAARRPSVRRAGLIAAETAELRQRALERRRRCRRDRRSFSRREGHDDTRAPRDSATRRRR